MKLSAHRRFRSRSSQLVLLLLVLLLLFGLLFVSTQKIGKWRLGLREGALNGLSTQVCLYQVVVVDTEGSHNDLRDERDDSFEFVADETDNGDLHQGTELIQCSKMLVKASKNTTMWE